MSAPMFAPVEEDTADLLTLVADTETPIGRDHYEVFLDACAADAAAHGGIVSVNRVRAALTAAGDLQTEAEAGELQIEAHAFSGMWSVATGPGKPMVKTGGWETCEGSRSGNDGRPYAERRWVGGAR